MSYRDVNAGSQFNKPWTCANCKELHQGIFDLASFKPDYWQGAEEYQPNSTVLDNTHFLSEDLCVINGTHHFIRCVLELPIIGQPGERFAYGVWSSLSVKSFNEYLSFFDTGEHEGFGPWFGWFSNRLKGYPDTINMKCRVHPLANRQRPKIELEPIDHPLVKETTDGITIDRLIEIYTIHGHEFKTSN